MSDNDALSQFKPKNEGLFVKIKEGEPATLRVLTLDPLANKDKFGNTRFNFVVWSWTENRPQILSKGMGIIKQLNAIHVDPDFDPLNKIDVKISATGDGLETRYSVQVMPKTKELTNDMIKEAAAIKLEEKIPNGIRLSAYNEGEEVPEAPEDDDSQTGYEKAKATASKIKGEEADAEPDEEVDLSEIPFNMTGSEIGGQHAKETQIEKYGGLAGYSAEMKRRASARKTFGTGGFRHMKATDPKRFAKIIAERENARKKKATSSKDSATS